MAGDWLKMEANTPEKEEVLAITARMGWDDADITVGKLFRMWRWFDQHTTNGNAARVTSALLDRIIGVSGFCTAVQEVGWLEIHEHGITLPKFDRHNGTTAKSRALTAKRVAGHKANAKGNGTGNADGNAATVTGALPREEKSREDKKEAKASTAFAVPEWVPVEPWKDFVQMRKAMRNVPFTEAAAKGVVAELKKFCDAGADATELLRHAVTNGHRTVYAPKTTFSGNRSPPSNNKFSAAAAGIFPQSNGDVIDV